MPGGQFFRQPLARHAFLDAQNLGPNYLIVGVVTEDDTGLHFGGLDDLRIVQAQVERIGFFGS